MKRTLFNAASKLMLEVCKDKDLDALSAILNLIATYYGPELADELNAEVIHKLSNHFPLIHSWMIMQAERQNRLQEEDYEVVEFNITVDDLVYLMISEGDLAEGKDFKYHEEDPDKLIITPKAYNLLTEILRETYQIGDAPLTLNLDDLVEVTEFV